MTTRDPARLPDMTKRGLREVKSGQRFILVKIVSRQGVESERDVKKRPDALFGYNNELQALYPFKERKADNT